MKTMQYPLTEIKAEISRICQDWGVAEPNFKLNQRKRRLGTFFYDSHIDCCPTTPDEMAKNGIRIEISAPMVKTRSRETVLAVIRHEMAHYLDYIIYGARSLGHGPKFQEINAILGGC